MERHEIPTHLTVEDKLFAGLSVKQLLELLCGATGAYNIALQGQLPLALRIGLAGGCVLGSAVFALLRPANRPLEEWLFVAVAYLASPRSVTWRKAEDRLSPPSRLGNWEQVAPTVAWEQRAPLPESEEKRAEA